MNFTLTINGETPAELLDTLTQLGGMTINVNTSPNGGVETHTMTAAELPWHASPLPQSEPVQQPDKPKAADHRPRRQTTAKAKKPTREPAAAPAEEPANPTSAPAQNAGAAATTTAPAAPSAPPATATTPAVANGSVTDPAMLNKIRDLARSLIVAGKRAGVQAAIKATGAASISKLPPDSYTSVWEELLKLKDEVDANASN